MSEKETTTESQKAEVIYLGIDTHVEKHVVVRKIDGFTKSARSKLQITKQAH